MKRKRQIPISRQIWGFLKTFGDAEVASLIAPRTLVKEYSPFPDVDLLHILPTDDALRLDRRARESGQPGRIETPDFGEVEREV